MIVMVDTTVTMHVQIMLVDGICMSTDVLQDSKAAQVSDLLVQGAVLQTSTSVYNDGADAKENNSAPQMS